MHCFCTASCVFFYFPFPILIQDIFSTVQHPDSSYPHSVTLGPADDLPDPCPISYKCRLLRFGFCRGYSVASRSGGGGFLWFMSDTGGGVWWRWWGRVVVAGSGKRGRCCWEGTLPTRAVSAATRSHRRNQYDLDPSKGTITTNAKDLSLVSGQFELLDSMGGSQGARGAHNP